MFDPYRLFSGLFACLDAETAHRAAIRLLKTGVPALIYPTAEDATLATHLWGRRFANPFGVAAGFDKHAEVPGQLLALGFGFAEVGGVTLRPQPGHPRPRVFRLKGDRAVINRMGFNNQGAAAIAARLAVVRHRVGPVGVNLGLNKDSQTAAADFGAVTEITAPHADFLTINVSSPNTPGLRSLQNIAPLTEIVRSVQRARTAVASSAPVLLKIAPDLVREDVAAIVDLALSEKLDGMVISNTTISRPEGLTSPARTETGGLSGRPLFGLSTEMLRDVYGMSRGALPLIGVGGIASGADAYAKIRAGASLVQLYTALVYEGPGLIGRMKADLVQLLKRDGFKTVAEAVGADHRQGRPQGGSQGSP
jgi:dihydroorotate dehydrogenase